MDDTSCPKLFFLFLWNVSNLLAVDVASVLRQLKHHSLVRVEEESEEYEEIIQTFSQVIDETRA